MTKPKIGILHYSAPPVIGGVEAVIKAHTKLFQEAGYPVSIIAGRGAPDALPPGTGFIHIPTIDSQYPKILELGASLEKGELPAAFDGTTEQIAKQLNPVLQEFDHLIIHNILTKHFNLPLTAAIYRLMDTGLVHHVIAWCHDITWTSPNSRSKVFPGYPWDMLRTYRPDTTYVTVSQTRKEELLRLYHCPAKQIHVIYNGVEPNKVLGFSPEGTALIERLGLLQSDLVMIMPVRVTQAKNIEYALRLVAAIKEAGLRPKLVLTGPPDPHDEKSMTYFKSLQELRRQLNIEAEMRFVFESHPDSEQPLLVDMNVVGDLYRVSDLLLMPSHREGFGMPIVEAGLAGIPVVCTSFPAAVEIGDQDILIIDPNRAIDATAKQILAWLERNPTARLRRRTRQNYTWRAIFERDIEPLLTQSTKIQQHS